MRQKYRELYRRSADRTNVTTPIASTLVGMQHATMKHAEPLNARRYAREDRRRSWAATVRAQALNNRTGHTSDSGSAPYDRDEIAASLAADRAAETAVMAPVEVLFQHSADRSRGQSIVVKQNADGSFSAVDDVEILANHDVATSDEDTSSDEDAAHEAQPREDQNSDPSAQLDRLAVDAVVTETETVTFSQAWYGAERPARSTTETDKGHRKL